MPPVGYENIFPLKNARKISCSIEKYATGHSALWLMLQEKSDTIGYLYFSNVQFISAPMYWQSADFKLAPVSECEQLLVQMWGLPANQSKVLEDQMREENWVKSYNLYIVEKHDLTIKILASSVEWRDRI